MRVVTWNINSVRLRADLIERVATWLHPDVICLQETKSPDEHFPREAFARSGYAHLAIAGMKGYNGVAIASRLPIGAVRTRHFCDKQDCRHIQATIDGVEIHNFYIPAGGDIPDPDENVKFAHKLAFLDEAAGWMKSVARTRRPMILVGDLNVAPLPNDVWSHKQMLKVVSHTPIEVEKLDALQRAGKWVDAVRHFVPPEIQLYSWWSYRANDWDASDRGRRLDHIWVTPQLVPSLSETITLREARGWEGASDHVPVMVEIR
jgi:exodeoxyribonuclease-3